MTKPTKTIVWLVVIVVVVGLVWWGVRIRENSSAGAIKIGFIGPLTGSAAVYGEQARNAVLLAESQINQSGGIDGRQLDVLVQDGGCDGTMAASAWQELVTADGVKVVLGGNCSTETLTVAPLAAQDGVLALADLTSASTIPDEGEWLFRNSPPNSYYAQVGGQFAYQQGVRKMVALTEQNAYSVDYSKNFESAFTAAGGTIVDKGFAPGNTDFRSMLTALKGTALDGVLLSSQGPQTMGIIVSQMHQLGMTTPVIFNSAFSMTPFLQATNGYVPPKHWGIVPYADPTASTTKAFLDAYQTMFNQPVTFNDFYIGSIYDMVFRLKAALETCGANEADTSCLRSYFQNATEWDGAAGKITFGSDHKPISPLAEVTIVAGKEHYQPISAN